MTDFGSVHTNWWWKIIPIIDCHTYETMVTCSFFQMQQLNQATATTPMESNDDTFYKIPADGLISEIFKIQENLMKSHCNGFSHITAEKSAYVKYKSRRDYWDNQMKSSALASIAQLQYTFVHLIKKNHTNLDEEDELHLGAVFHTAQKIMTEVESLLNDILFAWFRQHSMFIDGNEKISDIKSQADFENYNSFKIDYMEFHEDMVKIVALFRYVGNTINYFLLKNKGSSLDKYINLYLSHFKNDNNALNSALEVSTWEYLNLTKKNINEVKEKTQIESDCKSENEYSSS